MAKPIKIYSPDKTVLMEIKSLERSGNNLVIKGKIMGSMPMTAVVRPEEARNLWPLLNLRLMWFLATFLFRRSKQQ